MIESRFPNYAVAYGDINREQAQKAINWANSILKEPINLPIRVDGRRLIDRLELIKNKIQCTNNVNMLECFTNLIITDDIGEYGELIREKCTKNQIVNFFTNELNHYKSGLTIGSKRLMIDFLNQGNEFEDLCDICCINENGPKYNCIDFAKTIALMRIFINEDKGNIIDVIRKSSDKPMTVIEQFKSAFLDISGMVGTCINRYISLKQVLDTIK